MNNIIKTAAFITFLIPNLSFAALPPFYQSLKEYQSLLNSPELTNKLGSPDLILDISRSVEEASFTITTIRHTLKVDVVYDPPGHQGFVGPAQYHLVFHDPVVIQTQLAP